LPDGRNNAVWTIDTPVPVMDVAYCYPYGPDEIAALIRDTQGYWKTDTIGISPQGRPIVRLANRYGSPGAEEPGLYLMARQHSGETPGSWVLDGLLRHMTTLGDAAPLIWVVPLANIDGVMQGDYGKDNFPYDLNRAWGQVPMRHETLLIQRDMQRWAKRCRPALAADFHAPGACETDGIYCFRVSPQHAPREHEATLPWTTAIRASVDARYCAPNFERVAQYASRWETPNFTRASAQAFSIPAFSMEVPYGRCGDLVLTVEEYREAGARIARGMAGVLAAG